ncbi:DNA mismatch repair protein MutL [Calothrix sp. NIES-4071]|nr:DNA mismatch repair protein MutL [Calothrix sp. NIES-4071]BAZ61460.1 DNA mismatch repair protein MutL [Calothrix sp. NIES-4105]
MATTIQTLPQEVVHLITASEVIDSFAAVVRELVENSLDAGATRIVVYLYPEQWRIRVADNGCGMNYDDLQLSASAHSTSKIHSGADLFRIHSLGFRGEALHSLTTLADLEIMSRASHNCGFRVIYGNGGKISQIEAVAMAPGTVITVSNLFGNCPVRRQGLPSFAQQMKAVQETIHQIALCHPHVAWQVWQNERIWINISPAPTMGKLLPQILSRVRQGDLHELTLLELSENNFVENKQLDSKFKSNIYIVIGLPDRCHRHRPDWVRFAINKRMVKATELEQTVFSAFHRTLPRDRYPVCLLHLTISPEQINWNRNPAKTEIYLNNLTYWQQQINQAIEQALRINSDTLPEAVQTSRVSKLIKAAEQQKPYRTNRSIQPQPNPKTDTSAPTQHSELSTQNSQLPTQHSELSTQNSLKAVAQVSNMYIVVEHPGGMWLVEQHIAHERVLYEQICDNWQLVAIEPPLILYQLSFTNVEQLQRIGLDIEPFGENLWAVRTVPAMLKAREDCNQAILELSTGGDLKAAQVAVACRTAIRNGTHLNLDEMQNLIEQWQRTRNPHTCPHGRPICLSLLESSLSKYFKRHWVVGKSHGI